MIMGSKQMPSNKHQEIVKFIKELVKGKDTDKEGRRKGIFYPDVYTNEVDYEVELLNKNREIIFKSTKWDKTKKKVLIIGLDAEIEPLFDEVYFYQNGILKKIK